MIKLLKGATVYAPKHLGKKDILLVHDKIVMIENEIKIEGLPVDILDCSNLIIIPGVIDKHVHIIGGGGEGGLHSRVPEVSLSMLTKAGITTVVGLLGTDSITKNIESLLAKTKSLNEEGMNAYCITGAYNHPGPILTDSVTKDIVFIDEIRGCKLALSDHRASHITYEDFSHLSSEVRVARLVSGKKAYLELHIGDSETTLDLVNKVVDQTNIPIDLFKPTHVGRNKKLFQEAILFALKGGTIDITAAEEGNYKSISELMKDLKHSGVDLSFVTLSSDAMGSWSKYNKQGNLVDIGYSSCKSVFETVKTLIKEEVLSFEEAVSLCSINVAKTCGFTETGEIKIGNNADLLLLNKDLEIDSVIINGRMMVENKKALVLGTYE